MTEGTESIHHGGTEARRESGRAAPCAGGSRETRTRKPRWMMSVAYVAAFHATRYAGQRPARDRFTLRASAPPW